MLVRHTLQAFEPGVEYDEAQGNELLARFDEDAARLRRFADQDLTLVDAVGLHLMRDGRVASGWSTDRHLGLTGAQLAIHAA